VISIPDVLIAGGGPTGTSLALLLGRRGLRVLLVSGGSRGAWQLGEHLSPLGCRALARIGHPAPLLAGQVRCSGIDAAWGGPELQHTDYILESNGFGLLLDRRTFDAAAIAGLVKCDNVTLVSGRIVGRPARKRGLWTAQVRAGEAVASLRARVVIDATGRRSAVARALGARRRRADRLVAAVAWFHLGNSAAVEEDEGARLLLEAAADGWWYSAEMPGGRRVVAFLSDADLLGGASLESWRRRLRLTEHMRRALPARAQPAGFLVRPAESAILSRMSGPGWAAAGEAALALDPVSGSGLRCAFDDVAEVAGAMAETLGGSGDALRGRDERLLRFFRQYLLGRREIYRREMRWPDRPFWQRRHAILEVGSLFP
jgi:2-polyprenyl-6-methoxyphenol hydroxylase-like FAD-dependent oxidoreductase